MLFDSFETCKPEDLIAQGRDWRRLTPGALLTKEGF